MSRDPDVFDRVHDALTLLAEALESGRADRVLGAEPPVAAAAAALADAQRDSLVDDVRLRARLLETRLALERCRSLGETSRDLLTVMLPSQQAYGRAGRRATPAAPFSSVSAKV
jgi:hypothetical protein